MIINGKNGITLIALVITIIILLIISGIVISAITGEEGLIGKSKESANKYNDAAKIESEIIKNLLNGNESVNELVKPIINNIYTVGFSVSVPENINGNKYVFTFNEKEYETTQRTIEIFDLEPNTQYGISIKAISENGTEIEKSNIITRKTKPGKKLYYKGNEFEVPFTQYKQTNATVNLVKNESNINMTYACSSTVNWNAGIKKTLNINNTVSCYTKLWIYVEEINNNKLTAGIGTIGSNAAGYYPTEVLASCKLDKGVGLYEINVSKLTSLNELFFDIGTTGTASVKISNIWIEGVETLTVDEGVENDIKLEVSNIGYKTADIKVLDTIDSKIYRYIINGQVITTDKTEYAIEKLQPAKENTVYVQIIDEDFKVTKTKPITFNSSKWLYYEGNEFEDGFETYKQINANVVLNKNQSNLVVNHSCSSSVSWHGGIKKTLNIKNTQSMYSKIKIYVDAAVGTTNITAGIGKITANSGGYYPSTVSASCNINSGVKVYEINIASVTDLQELYINFAGTGSRSVTISKIEIE